MYPRHHDDALMRKGPPRRTEAECGLPLSTGRKDRRAVKREATRVSIGSNDLILQGFQFIINLSRERRRRAMWNAQRAKDTRVHDLP